MVYAQTISLSAIFFWVFIGGCIAGDAGSSTEGLFKKTADVKVEED